jgi:hypothetical protein
MLANATDFSSKGFTLTIPSQIPEAGYKPGTRRAGSQGYRVFLNPLPPGEPTTACNVRVTPTGALSLPSANLHFADIIYKK